MPHSTLWIGKDCKVEGRCNYILCMLQPLFSDTNGSAMARLHAILFVIRMCGCWMLLLSLHKYFLAYFYVSHPMIKYGRHLTVHLHRRSSRGGQKIYFSFGKHEKVTYWWNVCSERKKKPLCCLKNVIFVCSANCKFPSSLQETVPPPKKIT